MEPFVEPRAEHRGKFERSKKSKEIENPPPPQYPITFDQSGASQQEHEEAS